MEIYYAIVNLLDYIALNSGDSIDDTLIDICYKLLPYLEGDDDKEKISSIADANDCGYCTDFKTMIKRLRILHQQGKRGLL